MRKRLGLLVLSLLLVAGAVGGATAWANDSPNGNETPEEAVSVAGLLDNPVYDIAVPIQGEVTLLGKLLCPCFVLVSGGETIQVWYGLMVEDDGTEMPPVSAEGIENGDWVVITGELKRAGQHTSLNDFWATSIEKSATQIVGGTPGSCGYVWDAERDGWHRPWDPNSFIPAEDKPEWDEFIASPVVASDILVDGSYAGKEVEIVAGGSLTVTLESNPTTGFQWVLVDNSDETALQQVGHEYVAYDNTDPPLPGVGGIELWSFKTLMEGKSIISMEYSQPWEGGEQAAETFVMTVVVR